MPKELKSQTSYQILVSTSMTNLDQNIGEIWNSQEVDSPNTTNVKYDGKTLQRGTYYWKVRVWDEIHRTGEYTTANNFKIN